MCYVINDVLLYQKTYRKCVKQKWVFLRDSFCVVCDVMCIIQYNIVIDLLTEDWRRPITLTEQLLWMLFRIRWVFLCGYGCNHDEYERNENHKSHSTRKEILNLLLFYIFSIQLAWWTVGGSDDSFITYYFFGLALIVCR